MPGVPVTSYTDDGCEVSPTCLTCPLAACRYDDNQFYRVWHRGRGARAQVLQQVQSGGIPLLQASGALGITVKSLKRALAKDRYLA